MDTERAARAWVEAWLTAWPSGNADALASLYDAEAVFLSHPFRTPLLGPAGAREYVRWAHEDQQAVECAFGEPIVDRDRAAVEWWAIITARDGSQETVAGTSVIRFAPDGHVLEDCAYWASQPGRHEPPSTFDAAAHAQS